MKTLVTIAAVSAANTAFASPCDQVLSEYADGYIEIAQLHPECFGASPQNSTVSINQSSFVHASAISSALADRFLASPPTRISGLGSGIAAAAPGKRLNVWGNLTGAETEQKYIRPAPASNSIRMDNDSLTAVIGGDYAFSPTMVAGLSASFDRTTGSSYANGSKQNNLTNKGYLIAPYIGLAISKELALDASLGYGQGDLSQTGNVSADADRWFAGVNLNYSKWFGNTQISGRIGWQHGEEDYSDSKFSGTSLNNTGAKNKIDQVRLGVQASWYMNGIMPYVGLAYLNDHRSTSLDGAKDPIGNDAWQWAVGANFMSLSSGVTGGIAFRQEESRSHQKNQQLVANIGLRF